jgi:hypothetical protein
LETGYINLVHPIHAIMLYTWIWKWQEVSYIINVYINIFDKQKWWEKKEERGLNANLLVWYIYICTFVSTIKLVSSVILSEPNNKVSIEITA